jgi:type IV pilus assembly protein PilP
MNRSLLPFFFLACTPEKPADPKPIVPVSLDAPAPEPEATVEDEAYAYSSIGKADPFRSFLREPERDPRKVKPLQRWELDQLHLVAVVLDGPQPYAMVEDPKGRGHVLRRGDLIGKNWGRVASIEERTVNIREELLDAIGRRSVHFQSMSLPKPPSLDDEDTFEVIDG